ncbi:PTS fructose transporter subunit IIA [Lactiplantibacillus argentoratensis]|uniref:PTS sugar transporter subunit IIA n=1 Tax=Lactiplantibacillus argentoratensis TaxID=271881 RepID=UPI001BDC2C0C|nr:PTS fructose transporter subunit IIA [Lactiplantibacillus argentoratensis]MBT1145073.1 PTS fructose transporter subunit IIA [Lactiplantibacillus argentoratensis]MBT1147921.1 PTS fructose transporter subunit IIA [Lactiplantibacillus argentoratensis]MBT1150792.1 PTS fructose transporter subunit IIA [Lactiplantibacillus argentoratensis]
MKYLLLISHGDFSSGLKQTLGMFAGDDAIGSVIAVGLKLDEAASTFGTRFEALLKTLPEDASFVVLADIVGGSPLTTVCNILNDHGKLQDTLVLGGMNFPMALNTLMSKDSLDNSALKEKAFSEATVAIKEFQTTSSEASDDDDI